MAEANDNLVTPFDLNNTGPYTDILLWTLIATLSGIRREQYPRLFLSSGRSTFSTPGSAAKIFLISFTLIPQSSANSVAL